MLVVSRAELDTELKLACPRKQTDLAAPVDIMTEGKLQEKTLTEKEKERDQARGWEWTNVRVRLALHHW